MAFNLFKRDASIKAAKKDNRLVKVKGKSGIIQAKQARRISKINPSTGVISIVPNDSQEEDEDTGGGAGADPKPEKDNTTLYWGLGGAALLAIVLLRK
jgi:hypothetical protein